MALGLAQPRIRPAFAAPALGLAALAALAALGSPTGAAPAQPPAPLGDARLGEPIVVPASALDRLFGTPAWQLYAFALHDGAWQRIALQLDERGADGSVLADDAGDGALSAGDELVLLVDEAGEQAADGGAPGGMTGATARAEIRVAEPGATDAAAYVYLFRHPAGPEDAPPRRLAWDPDARALASEHVVLGLADPEDDGFVGIERLSLGDGPDLLDRLKFRARIDLLGTPTDLNEESFANPLLANLLGGADLAPEPVKVGPVRAVFGPGEGASVYPRRGALVTGLEGLGDLGGGTPLPIALTGLRISLDFLPSAAGGTYADANLPGGVLVDGQPDEVPASPLPAYRELRTPGGRIVLLSGAPDGSSADSGSATVFYADDLGGLPDDTGDGQSWGETGVAADALEDALAAGFPGRFVVLPPDSAATGDALVAAAADPLEVVVTALDATDPPTAAPSPTPTATAPPSGGTVHLPWCGNRTP